MKALVTIILMALIFYIVGFLSKKSDNIYYYCGAGAGLLAAAGIIYFGSF